MKRSLLIGGALSILIGIGFYLLQPRVQRIYAVGNRTVEFTFLIVNAETKMPIRGASVEIWDEPIGRPRKRIAELVTDDFGVAKYVRENQFVEDVIGIAPATGGRSCAASGRCRDICRLLLV